MIFKYKCKCFFLHAFTCYFVMILSYTNITAGNSRPTNKEGQFSSKLEHAQESFYNVYYELLKQDYFCEKNDAAGNLYNNNLIINEDALQTGTTLLTLIAWLNKKNDQNSLYLLKKINKYLFLHFHRFICEIDQRKVQNTTILGTLHDLYHFKKQTPTNKHPFRMGLSCAILLIFSINYSNLPYDEKRETLSLALDKIKRELLAVRTSTQDCPISTPAIKTFMETLETHATKEPIIKPSSIKRTIKILVVITIVVIIFMFVVKDSWRAWLKDKWDKTVGGWLNEFADTQGTAIAKKILDAAGPAGKKFGDGLIVGVLNPTAPTVGTIPAPPTQPAVPGAPLGLAQTQPVAVQQNTPLLQMLRLALNDPANQQAIHDMTQQAMSGVLHGYQSTGARFYFGGPIWNAQGGLYVPPPPPPVPGPVLVPAPIPPAPH